MQKRNITKVIDLQFQLFSCVKETQKYKNTKRLKDSICVIFFKKQWVQGYENSLSFLSPVSAIPVFYSERT